jgi:hypothetical protein
MPAELECVMIHEAMQTVQRILTVPGASMFLAQRKYRKKKQSSGVPKFLDIGRRAETLSRKI